MVVDDDSLRVISSVLGMYNLMEQRVTIVEDLKKKRAPFRDMAALYFLSPTDESVNRLIEDWTPSESRKEPLYGDSAFMYFISRLPDHLLAKIKKCRPLVKRAKALGEVNVDFLAKEERAFHLDMDSCFSRLFLRGSGRDPSRDEITIANRIVTLCATLNEYPHIRYPAASAVCTKLAGVIHMKMNEFVGSNQAWWYHGDSTHTQRGRSTFLLLDRSHDCLSPLMHEFTYQAMVYDLIPVDDDRISYEADSPSTHTDEETKANTTKEVLLNENDDVWVELRHKHIADVVQTLGTRIREIVQSNTGKVLGKKGSDAAALSLSQMANALKALPEYREVMSKLSQHMHISHQCMDLFNRQGLLDLSELEQTLATGKDEGGRTPRINEMVEKMEAALQGIRDSVTRIRLLAILIVSQKGLRTIDRDRLLGAARLSSAETNTLANLEKLGITMVRPASNNSKITPMFKRLASSSPDDSESEYTSSRYVSSLKGILRDMQENKLSLEEYPSVLPMPEAGSSSGVATTARPKAVVGSARKGGATSRSRWTQQNEATPKKKPGFQGGRQIVFVVGGMCYSELRSVSEVTASGDIEFIAGSTRFITPADFVDELSSLG